ncbi:uncharacterized protein METZ01_LOCUS233886, partial [marine metagenome]
WFDRTHQDNGHLRYRLIFFDVQEKSEQPQI